MVGKTLKPDFLILTFPKSGSTSLHQSLKQHPDICLPLYKETWYFSRNYAEGESWYRERFWHCKQSKIPQRVVEISTEFLLKDEYLERIKETLPGAKIVVLLRDPVQRSVSHYYHSIREGFETRSITEVLVEMENTQVIYNKESMYKNENTYENESIYKYGYLTFSLRYRLSIETLLKLYDRQNIKFILFEELIKEEGKVLHELQSFFEVKPIPLSLMRENVAGVSRGKSLKFLTGFPLLVYRKLNGSKILDKSISLDHKRKTREIRNRFLSLLKKIARLGNKELSKPPLNDELKEKLVVCFNKELKGIEKITGLPIAEYWPWYRP
jgi:hypothetical protein